MLRVTCPICGAVRERDNSHRGKVVECPVCFVPMTMPNGDSPTTAVANPEDAPIARIAKPAPAPGGAISEGLPPWPDASLPSIRKDAPSVAMRWSRVLVVVVILSIGALMFVPSVEKVRSAAARSQSMNNLKQMTLACQGFHDMHKRLPFNGSNARVGDFIYATAAQGGNPMSGSWAFQILPFIDQAAIFDQGPVGMNRNIGIGAYMNPGRGRPPFAQDLNTKIEGPWIDFFLNIYLNTEKTGSDGWDKPDAHRTLKGITDGMSNTICVGEGTIATGLYTTPTIFPGAGVIWAGGTEGTARGGANVAAGRALKFFQ